jgi:hypothetical protein
MSPLSQTRVSWVARDSLVCHSSSVRLSACRQARLSSKLKDSIIDEDLDGDDEDEYLPERDRKKGGSKASHHGGGGARPLQRSPERPPPSRERQDTRAQMPLPTQQLQQIQLQYLQARETCQVWDEVLSKC